MPYSFAGYNPAPNLKGDAGPAGGVHHTGIPAIGHTHTWRAPASHTYAYTRTTKSKSPHWGLTVRGRGKGPCGGGEGLGGASREESQNNSQRLKLPGRQSVWVPSGGPLSDGRSPGWGR